MSYVWGPTDALWAARLGELCGRAQSRVGAEEEFLDGWMQLLAATGVVLEVRRSDGGHDRFTRGVVDQAALELPADPSEPVAVLSGPGAPRLLVRARTSVGDTIRMVTQGGEGHGPLLLSLYPCVEAALRRLADHRGAPGALAARSAWERTPAPMLLLDEDLQPVVVNPAARAQLGLGSPPTLPGWLAAGLARSAPTTTGEDSSWTATEAGATWRVSLLRVEDDEELPGTWLVTAFVGGPRPEERVGLARARWGLTPREGEIASLLAEGLSNRQIAGATGVSEATVKAHFVSIMRKAGVASRTELLTRYYGLHLTDVDVAIPPDARRLRTGHIWLDDEGIVNCAQDAGTEIDLPDIHAFVAAVSSLAGDEGAFVYSDATGVRSSSREATKEAGKPMPFVRALAIRGGSAVSRALVHLWLKLFRPQYPTRMFATRDEAMAWLRTLRDG